MKFQKINQDTIITHESTFVLNNERVRFNKIVRFLNDVIFEDCEVQFIGEVYILIEGDFIIRKCRFEDPYDAARCLIVQGDIYGDPESIRHLMKCFSTVITGGEVYDTIHQ